MEISTRESEVLALVGDHLSNAEIAARLFISVRTVESHVSALLRKLAVPDRRALARHAPDHTHKSTAVPVLPRPLTSFIGREAERAALADLVTTHRQVTALGPGGVGKTRLALRVAAAVTAHFDDGVWFVDLVSTTDPDLVAAAVAAALGLGEQPDRGMHESVISALSSQHALVVLDNCEQVVDAVAAFLERLLSACPRLSVLATSRARLMVPFEHVYPVPPLSLSGDGDSDAVELFTQRAAAAGQAPDASTREAIAHLCQRLDGMALAIELAAARWPTLGLDGLTAALSDPLRMLSGGSRAADRHRSVRAALDWSHALLAPDDQKLLRRVAVFAAPFTMAAAVHVTGIDAGVVADGLARLSEQSLLTAVSTANGTRYRGLETIRQYGTERLADADEESATRQRHVAWCLATATDLTQALPDWRARFDTVADELRAALAWASRQAEHRADAHDLAARLAALTFTRGLIGESQQRHEQAAALATDPRDAAVMLRGAAAVAACRMRGDDMYRLHLAAADAARDARDTPAAARDLATAATHAYRFSGKFTHLPSHDEVVALIDQARDLAGDDPDAVAAVALAEAGVLYDAFGAAQGPADNNVPDTLAHARRAVALARDTGDAIAQSAALDTLTGAQSWGGDAFGVAATINNRITLVTPLSESPQRTLELTDALSQAIEAALGVGDLPGAREWVRRLAEHPLLTEVSFRATSWLLVIDALAGDVADIPDVGERFAEAWRRAGSPRSTHLAPAAAAAVMAHDLGGDETARREWEQALDHLGTLPGHAFSYLAIFDSIRFLHDGDVERAWERTAPEPDDVWKWVTWLWLHWYVAVRCEAAVLAGRPDAAQHVAKARTVVAANPVAGAMVERADALLKGDRDRVAATARALTDAGCGYQAARSLVLAGGDHAARGQAALAKLGLRPMAPGPEIDWTR